MVTTKEDIPCEQRFDLLTGKNADPALYLKYEGRKDGVELYLTLKEILNIFEWANRVLLAHYTEMLEESRGKEPKEAEKQGREE